jgi:hypothetical protein
LVVLSGAALSGELEMPVYVDFEMRDKDGGERRNGDVHISFSDKRKRSGRVRRGA